VVVTLASMVRCPQCDGAGEIEIADDSGFRGVGNKAVNICAACRLPVNLALYGGVQHKGRPYHDPCLRRMQESDRGGT
jgi:hypothetical protein